MNPTATLGADFAAGLYDRLASTRAGKDLVLSPFSIQVALAMTAAGAKGETRKAMADLIGAPNSVADRQYAEWIKAVHGANDDQLATANALWVQQGFRFRPDYKKAIADLYD